MKPIAPGTTASLLLLLAACAPAASPSAPSSRPSAGEASTGASAEASAPPTAPEVGLETVLEGLTAPVDLVPFPDGSGRAALVEQHGVMHVLAGGDLLPQPFLDIRDRVIRLSEQYDERGLLGLAFHPGFAENGRVFIYYSAPVRADPSPGIHDHTNVLAEFRVRPGAPEVADPASERRILEFEQPQFNHSGGGLGFGPDGHLYLGAGDGGGAGDQDYGHSEQGNAQDLAKLNGKILRIDVDGDQPYAIPADNPFIGFEGARPEIYALGFRNPWRLAWEPEGDRRLLVSDVGWGSFEEIDVVERGGNYGWRVSEGTQCVDLAAPLEPLPTCAATDARGIPLSDPVVAYSHEEVGIAVIGGHVYRGGDIPALRGRYVFADYSSSRETGGILLMADPRPSGPWPWRPLVVDGGLDEFVTGLGQGPDGELYVMVRGQPAPTGATGRVLRMVPVD